MAHNAATRSVGAHSHHVTGVTDALAHVARSSRVHIILHHAHTFGGCVMACSDLRHRLRWPWLNPTTPARQALRAHPSSPGAADPDTFSRHITLRTLAQDSQWTRETQHKRAPRLRRDGCGLWIRAVWQRSRRATEFGIHDFYGKVTYYCHRIIIKYSRRAPGTERHTEAQAIQVSHQPGAQLLATRHVTRQPERQTRNLVSHVHRRSQGHG